MFKDWKIQYLCLAFKVALSKLSLFSIHYSGVDFGEKNLYCICVKLQNISGLDLMLYSYVFSNFLFITLCIIVRQYNLQLQGPVANINSKQAPVAHVSCCACCCHCADPQTWNHSLVTVRDATGTGETDPRGQCNGWTYCWPLKVSPGSKKEKGESIHGWIYWPHC